LLALTEDQDAVAGLRACSVDLDRLRREVLNYVDNELANLVAAHGHDAKPTASFQRVLQRAAIHVPSSGREEVTGANVLVAMFAERESHAAFFLQEQNMTRFDAVNYISQERPGVRKQAERGGVIPVPGLGRECWAENGVFAARWLLPTNRRAGQDGECGGRSTILGAASPL
jgi:ATP-dependent Clp protease ATP-binding subunit ClpA